MKAYCSTCRTHFAVIATPPHAVIHLVGAKDEAAAHLHALTREPLVALAANASIG